MPEPRWNYWRAMAVVSLASLTLTSIAQHFERERHLADIDKAYQLGLATVKAECTAKQALQWWHETKDMVSVKKKFCGK